MDITKPLNTFIMDQAEKTMIDNLKNTSKMLKQWIVIVKEQNIVKRGEIINFLKDEYGLSYGFSNLVAHKSKGSDAGSAKDTSELVEKQFKGKERFHPLYENLLAEILKFGNEIEVVPKNAYLSLRRKKQFALLQPATKTRFEIGLIPVEQEPEGLLEAITTSNAMCSHKINIEKETDITQEVLNWIYAAYEKAG